MREVESEKDLPCPAFEATRKRHDFLRSKSDPRVMMDCRSGECFTLRSGQNWERPAYQYLRAGYDVPWESIASTTAYADSDVYPRKETRAA